MDTVDVLCFTCFALYCVVLRLSMEDPHLQYSCTDLASGAKCETAAYPLIRIFKQGNKQLSLPNRRCSQQPQQQQHCFPAVYSVSISHSPSSVFLSVCQNLFEADPKPCFTASPNSYYTHVFCSTFAKSALSLACWYMSAAFRVPQPK